MFTEFNNHSSVWRNEETGVLKVHCTVCWLPDTTEQELQIRLGTGLQPVGRPGSLPYSIEEYRFRNAHPILDKLSVQEFSILYAWQVAVVVHEHQFALYPVVVVRERITNKIQYDQRDRCY